MFAREFKKHGMTHLSHFMKSPRIGDYMDVNVQGHIHKGMPHKGYQGKTGVVFNVSPRSVGLLMKKQVGGRYIEKRIYVRLEHVNLSKSRQDFVKRVKENERLRKEAKARGEKLTLKRTPQQPRAAHIIKRSDYDILTVSPIPYESLL